MFEKGDRVSENGLVGTVTKMHGNGKVVDVLFDEEEYARRRQVENVMKLRKNSKFGRIDARPATVFSGKFVGFTKKALIFETKKYGTLFIPKSSTSTLYRVITTNKRLDDLYGITPDARYIVYRDKREKMKKSPLAKNEIDGLSKNVDLVAVSEWWAESNGIKNEPKYEKYFIRTGFGRSTIRPPLLSEWRLKNSPANLEDYVEYMKIAGVVPWQLFQIAYQMDENTARNAAQMVNEMQRKPGEGKRLDDAVKGFAKAVQPMLKKNPRKPSRKKYGVAISGKFKGFTKSAGGQLKAGIFETKKYGTVFFPAANFNTNWLLFKHSYYSPDIDIFVADRGTIQHFDSVSPSDFRYIKLAKGKDILVLPEWLANKKGLENESASEKKVLKSTYSNHFTLPSQQPKQNPTRYFFRMNPKNVPEYIPQTPRSRATSRYVFPKQKSYPIGDLYHARSALVFALSPTNESKRKKVLNAVAKLYPMYNWSKWWNKRAKGKRDVKPWSFYVKKKQPARRERMLVAANPKQYTTHLPLIIGCGASKNPGKLPANQKYAKGYWATYRANTPSMPNQDAATYVLSAKYGIIPETQEITSYDKVIVPSSKRTLKRNEVRASTVANKLANQLEPQVVILVGGEAYAEALELAGFTPIMVENLSEFPGKKARGGMGKKNAALKWFISDFLPSRRPITPQRVGSRRKGATTSSVVANLTTQDGIVKTLYQIRVNGIYKGEVRRALGLRSNASFGKGRKRLDLRLPRAERRKLLNLAFGAATQAMRKEGLLAKSGSKNMFRLSKNKFKLLVDKNQSRTENYYTSRIAEFEKALELTRKTK